MTATDLMNEPIHPTRVLPTEADVADALIQHETSGMCHYRRTCGTCDCGRSSLTAKGLAEQVRAEECERLQSKNLPPLLAWHEMLPAARINRKYSIEQIEADAKGDER